MNNTMSRRILLAILMSLFSLYSISSAWADDTNSQKLEKPSSNFLSSLLKLGSATSSDVATKIVSFHESFEAEGLAFSPDGRYLATTNYVEAQSGDEREVHIWDWRNEKLVQKLTKPKFSDASETTDGLQWSPDGRFLAVCTGRAENHEVIRIWSTHDWQIASDIIDDGVGGCNSLVFSMDSQFLMRAVARARGVGDGLNVYGTKTWMKLWGMNLGSYYQPNNFFSPITMALSPDGLVAALQGSRFNNSDGELRTMIVDLVKHTVVSSFAIGNAALMSLAFNANGQQIAYGAICDVDDTNPDTLAVLQIRDVKTGNRVNSEVAKVARVVGLHYTSDGRYLIASYLDDKIKIWDAKSMQLK
jgi:WD40 repeat protein